MKETVTRTGRKGFIEALVGVLTVGLILLVDNVGDFGFGVETTMAVTVVAQIVLQASRRLVRDRLDGS